RHAASVDPATLQQAVADAGYTVADSTTELTIGGMNCASCVAHVERALAAVPGVVDASVNLATGKTRVRHFDGAADAASLVAAVRKAGYEATPAARGAAPDRDASRAAEITSLKRSVLVAAAGALPLFLLEMGGHVFPAIHHGLTGTFGQQNLFYLYFVLASIVQFGPGLYFYRTGWRTLVRGTPDMNALVMLGA